MQHVLTTHPISAPIARQSAAKWSYVSLIYSLFYFFPVALGWEQSSLSQIMAAIAVYALFIALFLRAVHSFGSSSIAPILGIIALSSIGSSINSGCNALFGYAAFLSSYYFNARLANLFLLFNLCAQLVTAHLLDIFHLYYLGPSVAVTVSLFVYGRFSQKDCVHQLEAVSKNEQIEQLATIAERERIARDMHDLLGHSLSSLALKSELAAKLSAKGMHQKAQEEINQVADLARQTLAEVREAVTGLKQQSLDQNIHLLTTQLENLGYETKANIALPKLNAKMESCLNMLCKEWITNILRHSNGSKVAISLFLEGENIHLTIDDDGQTEKLVPGNGIEGMKSRIRELGGKFQLNHEDGVRLKVALPATGGHL